MFGLIIKEDIFLRIFLVVFGIKKTVILQRKYEQEPTEPDGI